MKIGLIGNMNNISFAIARHLKDFGHDPEVLITSDDPVHFHPCQDTYSNTYKSFTRSINWGDPASFLKLTKDQVRRDTDHFDFVMGCGIAPAAMEMIGRRLDVFTPYGYDLYSLPFYKLVHPLRMPAYLKLAYMQRKGVRNAPYMIFDRTNDAFENTIQKLQFQGQRIVSTIPMLYDKEYDGENVLNFSHQHPSIDLLKKLRSNNDVLFLQHIRQIWKSKENKWSLKANDLLIKAYAQFLQRNPSVSSKLILFEYGIDVAETKKLISELKITDSVVWLPKMPRKFVMITLSFADMVIGEMQNSWLTYGAVCEALCMAKPFMHKRIDKEFKSDYESLYPMIYADSLETVLVGLEGILNNPEEYKKIGVEGKQWFQTYFIDQPLANILHIIQNHVGS